MGENLSSRVLLRGTFCTMTTTEEKKRDDMGHPRADYLTCPGKIEDNKMNDALNIKVAPLSISY
eukprot:scaffold1128_cov41-Attheya_sp.AAC.3